MDGKTFLQHNSPGFYVYYSKETAKVVILAELNELRERRKKFYRRLLKAGLLLSWLTEFTSCLLKH